MKKGFTLSEVLITVTIVGLIASLTIPAIMNNYKNKIYIASLKKVYSQLADATQSIMNDEHTNNFYETTAGVPSSCNAANPEKSKGACYFLTRYFKTIKTNCNYLEIPAGASQDQKKKLAEALCVAVGSNSLPTDADAYKTLRGTNAGSLSGEYCVQTSNGAAICQRTTDGVTSFNIDVNGSSPPNVTGKDVFWMTVKSNGTIVDRAEISADPDAAVANCGQFSSEGCLRKVMQDGWRITY